jgi:hypothetical protein
MKRVGKAVHSIPSPPRSGRRAARFQAVSALRVLTAVGLALTGALAAGFSKAVSAQSIFGGEVEGRVLDEAGYPLRGAAVTLTEAGGENGLEERTRDDGVFWFSYVPGGVYDLRVEALGFRPMLVVGVGVAPGDRVNVPVVLVAEPPPVTGQDTVHWSASGRAAPPLGRMARGMELEALPDRVRDLAGLMAISSWADPSGGLEGLPAGYTTLFSDGEPFRPAIHPGLAGTGDPFGYLFPRVGLQSANVLTGLEDIEWSGTPGGLISVETRAPAALAPRELFGLWSGGATWGNEVVGGGPAMLSAWGGGTASFPVSEKVSPLTLNLEGGVIETPNLYWRNDYFTDGLIPDAPAPGTRTSTYGAGSARVDFNVGADWRATIRGGFATFQNQSDRLGTPQGGYGSELPGKGTDGSLAAVVAHPILDDFLLEVKGSLNFSSRSWEPEPDAYPGAFLVSDRALVGTNPSFPALSDRVDVSLTPVVHYQSGPNRLKGGLRLEHGTFDMTHVEESSGAFFFGSRSALTAGDGAGILIPGKVGSESFGVSRVSLFGQYRWTALPGLDITTSLSSKWDFIPLEDVTAFTRWTEVSGLSNARADKNLNGVDGRLHIRWDMQGDGSTWFLGGMGVEHGALDVGAIHEVLTLDGAVSVDRTLGGNVDWAEGGISAGDAVRGTRLAMFGPKLQAPMTTRAAMGLYRYFSHGVRVGISGAFRHTQFILRRADLNRLLEPVGTDQNGRPLYGDLRIVSGVLFAEPATNRRFPGFESAWALNPDGWSKYTGVTLSLDAPLGERGSISVHYTFSQTRDNWVGASRGGALSQLSSEIPVENWDESVSDFDIPHRLSAMVVLPLPLPRESYVSGLYTFRSAPPFTAHVASGLDGNGDGSPFNDVAFVPASGAEIQALAAEWDCISEALGGFAERNACRGDPLHTLDLRLSLGLPVIRGVFPAIVVDGLNLTDNDTGIRDDNLLVLGGGTVTSEGGQINVPYKVNPGFGNWVFRGDNGRMLRVGLRIGGVR